MNNDDIPSLDDALKDFEEVKQNINSDVTNQIQSSNPIPNPPANQMPSSPEVNQEPSVQTVNTEINKPAAYNIDGKNYSSLMEMLEDQEKNSTKVEQKDPDRFVKAFIGDNYEKFKNGGISFAYFFFGEYYLIFRKFILPAIIKYILSVGIIISAIMFYANGNIRGVLIVLGIYFLLQILPIFAVKRLYYDFAKVKVDKILSDNSGKTEEELLNICSSSGGTNIITPIVLFVIITLITQLRDRFIDTSVSNSYEITVRDLHTLSTKYLNLDDSRRDNQTVLISKECYVKITTQSVSPGSKLTITGGTPNIVNINNHDWNHIGSSEGEVYYTIYEDYLYMIELADYKTNKQCAKSLDILVKNLGF